MTTPNTTALGEREAFKTAYGKLNKISEATFITIPNGDYRYPLVNLCWNIWQAATSQQRPFTEDEAVEIMLRAYNDSCDEHDDRYASGGHMEVAYRALIASGAI